MFLQRIIGPRADLNVEKKIPCISQERALNKSLYLLSYSHSEQAWNGKDGGGTRLFSISMLNPYICSRGGGGYK
jgi:hypothetical protein